MSWGNIGTPGITFTGWGTHGFGFAQITVETRPQPRANRRAERRFIVGRDASTASRSTPSPRRSFPALPVVGQRLARNAPFGVGARLALRAQRRIGHRHKALLGDL